MNVSMRRLAAVAARLLPAEEETIERGGGDAAPRRLPEGWPLLALFALYPVGWVLGLGPLAAFVLAVPMVWQLVWTRRRVVIPVGTGLFLAFLVFTAASGLMIGKIAPGTTNGNITGTIIAFGFRFASCVAALVVLVYVSSSDERTLPTSRIINAFSVLFVATVVGGWLGILLPSGGFTAPFELLMPHFVRANDFAHTIIHPAFSQVQSVLGYAEGRPKAPFEYANTWGGMFSLLLPFHLLACYRAKRMWVRVGGFGVALLGIAPVVLSLNRGLWIALGISAVFGSVYLIRHGQLGSVVIAAGVGAAIIVALAASPLANVVSSRLDHPHSNLGRAFLYTTAAKGALDSPLLGWGGPRQAEGSAHGIAAAKSAKCQTCGTAAVGTQGTFWTLLFSNGFVATALYVGFFLGALRRSARETDLLAAAVTLTLILLLFEQFVYDEFPMSLVIAMAAIGLLTRRSLARRRGVPESADIWR